MTKRDLEHAQFFLSVAQQANRYADDAERRGDTLARRCDNLGAIASAAFWQLTGRRWSGVSAVELSTETPAPWTRNAPS